MEAVAPGPAGRALGAGALGSGGSRRWLVRLVAGGWLLGLGVCGWGLRRAGRAATASQIRNRFLDRHQLAGLNQPQQPDLQMQPRLQGKLQVFEQIERDLEITRQIFFGKPARNLRQPLPVRRSRPRSAACCAGDFRHQQIAEITGQFAAEMLQAAAIALQLHHQVEHPRANLRPPEPWSLRPANRAKTCPASRALRPHPTLRRSMQSPGRAPTANRARCPRPPAPARSKLRDPSQCLPSRKSLPCA